ncbi:MAG TPA: NUDIX domain-containing protein [Candidatus Nanoarchaeia archaeon]|nr:NUDIX domain-containing protein [Candidatus Nanoarchaeia archaeon]
MPKSRPQCVLLLQNNEGKILLQLRDDKPEIPYPGCWGTFGGQIEEKETPEEAITREIREETSYELTDPEYIGNFPFENYNQYVFRKIDLTIRLEALNITEGQKGAFLSYPEIQRVKLAFNAKEILEFYFKKYLIP